jgi:putative protease
VPPTSRETNLLRLYKFKHATTGKITAVVHPGHTAVFRVLFALFDQENITELTQRIILMNVLHKKQSLTQEQWDCLKLGRETLLHVLGEDLDKKYSAKYDALQNSQEIKTAARRLKTPRIGMEVCCCKGCNGCLIFWHDPTYEKARTLLAQKSRVSCLTTIYWNLMRRCWHCRLKPEISLPA